MWFGPADIAINHSSERYKLHTFGKSLEIINVTYEDRGKYRCEYPSQMSLTREFNLEVEGKYFDVRRLFKETFSATPSFPHKAPASRNASEGETVSFECLADGMPKPSVTFYKNGRRKSSSIVTFRKKVL